MYHHMYGDWGSPWDWLWMTLTILLWAGAFVAVGYWAGRKAASRQNNRKPPLHR